jgi:hypothetical protein
LVRIGGGDGVSQSVSQAGIEWEMSVHIIGSHAKVYNEKFCCGKAITVELRLETKLNSEQCFSYIVK